MPNPSARRWRSDLVADVTEADIAALRSQITDPVFQECFDERSDEAKRELAALSQKGFDRLTYMAGSEADLEMTGIEAIRDHLNFLFAVVPEFHKKWNSSN